MTGMIKMMRMNQWWDTGEDKEETENGMDDDYDDWSAQIKCPQLITWAQWESIPQTTPPKQNDARINYTANLAPQNGYKAEVTPAGATQLPWLLLRSEKCAHVSWCTDLSWDLTNNVHMCHDALTSIEMWKTFTNLSCRIHWLLWRSDKTSDICHDAPTSLEISRISSQMSHDTHVKLRKAGPRVVRCPMSCVGQKQRCQDDSRQCRD